MSTVITKKNKFSSMASLLKGNIYLHIYQFRNAFISLSFDEKEIICKTLKSKGLEINLYENPTPVCVAIVRVMTDKGIKILTVTRGSNPCIGQYCLPGGYVDKMENAQMGAARELYEETGLDLAVSDFTIIDSKISERNTIMLFCIYNHVLTESDIDFNFRSKETLNVSLGDEHTAYCFRTHQEIVNTYFLSN